MQSNALAAMSAGIEAFDKFAAECVQHGATQQLAALLSAAAPAPPTRQVALNGLGALGALGESSEAALEAVVARGGVPAALQWCSPEREPELQEAAADTVCKLMASGASAKDAAVAAGLIPTMSALLPAGAGNNDEVKVRALLAVGMIVGGEDDAPKVQFAEIPGAVASLLALMRREDDADCQQIAAGIFGELGRSPAAKEVLAAGIKAAHGAKG